MRIRCSKGLRISGFHGHFFIRSTDLLALPQVLPSSSSTLTNQHIQYWTITVQKGAQPHRLTRDWIGPSIDSFVPVVFRSCLSRGLGRLATRHDCPQSRGCGDGDHAGVPAGGP